MQQPVAAVAGATAVDGDVDDLPLGDQVIVPGHVPAVTDHLRVGPAVSGEQEGSGDWQNSKIDGSTNVSKRRRTEVSRLSKFVSMIDWES